MGKSKTLEKELNLRNDFPVPSFEEWKENVIRDLKGADYNKKLVSKTYEGIDLQPIYLQKDIESLNTLNSLPGTGNNIRGGSHSGYLRKSWEICQELPYGDAEIFNDALINDLSKGQSAINMVLDTASQLGLDADYATSSQVGDGGLSISGLSSFSRALQNVGLQKFPIYIQAGYSSLPMMMILAAYIKKNKFDISAVKGSVEADPLGFLITKGFLPAGISAIYDKMKLVIDWKKQNTVSLKSIGVNGFIYNSSGASAVQELAFVMSTAIEYMNELTERGLKAKYVADEIRFTFGIGSNYFMEIAKLRAARLVWNNILELYGVAEDERSIKIHARTALNNQTVYDPYVNMLRTTTETFSAIVGGVDSIHSNTFNETFAAPDEFSRRIARNTQIILNEEAHLGQLIDPAGGSYYVEWLTNEIAQKVWNEIKIVEEKGGMFEAIKAGYVQNEINKISDIKVSDIKKRKSIIVGTNSYANSKEAEPVMNFTDQNKLFEKRSAFLQKFRVSGNSGKNEAVLEKLQSMVDKNIPEVINTGIEALLAGATLGEISHIVRTSENTTGITPLSVYRPSSLFEKLRNAAFEYERVNGTKPTVFLNTLGSVKQFKARADFSRGFFEVGGFDVIYPNGFNSIDESISEAIKSNSKLIVLCSTDEHYIEVVPELAEKLKLQNPDITLILAGYPKEQIELFKKEGVDEFIYLGCDAYEILSKLMAKIGGLK